MTKRLIILLALLVAGFSSIYFLPKSFALQPSALPGNLRSEREEYELPHLVGYWRGGPKKKASDKEIGVLMKDTGFLKKSYLRRNTDVVPRPLPPEATDLERAVAASPFEEVEVSVVTSGSDMGNSIHRPERCLVAQGFTISGDRKMMLKVNGRDLPVKRLIASQHLKNQQTGEIHIFHNLTYYWFVGHDALTNDHYERTLLDAKDRLIQGYDQQWAYATVGMTVDPHVTNYDEGKSKDSDQIPQIYTRQVDAEKEGSDGLTEADKILQEFIVDLAKEVIDRKMIKSWNLTPKQP